MLRRGERVAVCAKTYALLTSDPYAAQIVPVPPYQEIPPEARKGFDCSRTAPRHPRETKGLDYTATTDAAACCDPETSCC